MDALKSVLQTLKLKPQLFRRMALTRPWSQLLSIENAAAMHVVEQGECWLHMYHQPVRHLAAGDLIVVSNTARYHLSDSAVVITPSPDISRRSFDDPGQVEAGNLAANGNAQVTLISGEFRPAQNVVYPLFSLMPSLIYIQNQGGRPVEWLQPPVDFIALEAQTCYPGFEIVISHLMDILFIMVMRYWIAHRQPGEGDYLQALYHPQIGEVLAAMHREPTANWTVESLSQMAHLSRSTFTELFTSLVGIPPMKYLTRWRLQLAISYLTEQADKTIEQISQMVGYESAYTFSKAFKRVVGVSPAEYRRNR